MHVVSLYETTNQRRIQEISSSQSAENDGVYPEDDE